MSFERPAARRSPGTMSVLPPSFVLFVSLPLQYHLVLAPTQRSALFRFRSLTRES